MVPRDRKDRPVVFAKGLIKLVVVILPLAEVVDYVAQVKEERWAVHTLRLHIRRHRVGDRSFVLNRGACGLRPAYFGRARVADSMEADFSSLSDGVGHVFGDVIR